MLQNVMLSDVTIYGYITSAVILSIPHKYIMVHTFNHVC